MEDNTAGSIQNNSIDKQPVQNGHKLTPVGKMVAVIVMTVCSASAGISGIVDKQKVLNLSRQLQRKLYYHYMHFC